MYKRILIVIISVGFIGGMAWAATSPSAKSTISKYNSHVYMNAFGGAAWIGNTDSHIVTTPSASGTMKIQKHHLGYNVGASLGYMWKYFSTEIALSYITGDVDHFKYDNTRLSEIGGETQLIPLMLNGFYRLNYWKLWTPYIGVGLGDTFARLRATSKNKEEIDGRKYVFVYQGIIGIAFNYDKDISVGLDYRRLGTTYVIVNGTIADGTRNNYRTHIYVNMLNINFIYHFD